MPRTQDSSPSLPTADTLLRRWLESKGLSGNTLARCGVRWEPYAYHLYFDYSQINGDTATRYIDLTAWHEGLNDKYWVRGSQARGALWSAYRSMYVGYMNRVLVCEGETDALAAVQARAPFHWIFAVPGANTICPELVDRVAKPHLELVLAFDEDDAGRTAREKFAWWLADRQPLHALTYPNGLNDLRDVLRASKDYEYPTVKVEQVPRIGPAPASPAPKHRFTTRTSTEEQQEKPDLNRVWDRLSPRSRATRKDASGRKIRQAWCPLHEDGEKPGAWVGEHRWGCFVCGIESADVYELVAWVRGYATPGQPLLGDSFLEARAEARRLD